MEIAVTYDNGMIFPHFGRTEQFKIYTVEEGKVVSSRILCTNGTGHEALAGLLAGEKAEVLICGGMGAGAEAALREAGIQVISGAEGPADEAVSAYLSGELESQGVNCSHHEEEEGCEGGCGNCGGGCGGCGGCHRPAFEGPNVGKTILAHYTGTFNDGTKFDSSYDRGEPLQFTCGAGMMIAGFDKAVADMKEGEVKEIHLMPEEAYGEADPDAVFTVELSKLPGAEDLEAGQQVYLYNSYGQPFPVRVVEKTEQDITFDANHEMAGRELNFRIEIVEIR